MYTEPLHSCLGSTRILGGILSHILAPNLQTNISVDLNGRHFTRKPVVLSSNVGCFLSMRMWLCLFIFQFVSGSCQSSVEKNKRSKFVVRLPQMHTKNAQ